MGFEFYLTLSEPEARALNELTKYGVDSFLRGFYGDASKSTIDSHKEGFTSLFNSIKSEIPKHLKRVDDTRKTFIDGNPNKEQ